MEIPERTSSMSTAVVLKEKIIKEKMIKEKIIKEKMTPKKTGWSIACWFSTKKDHQFTFHVDSKSNFTFTCAASNCSHLRYLVKILLVLVLELNS